MDDLRIKNAFQKVKEDIQAVKEQLSQFSDELYQLKDHIFQQTDNPAIQHTNSAEKTNNPAIQHTDSPLYALKTQNTQLSTGNNGVPADRQTDKQTNQHIINSPLDALPQVLGTLSAIKEEVRVKFRNLTNQEISVLFMIYALEDQRLFVDYSLLAQKLSLTESSIRDYIQRLIKKGIPLIKMKENNKKVFISISSEFKQLVSLSTLTKIKENYNHYSV